MKGLGRGLLGLLFVGVLVVGLAGLGVWRLGTASGQATVVRVVAPASVPASGEFQANIEIQNVTNLGSYEWQLVFDPALLAFKSAANSSFLGSTGRMPICQLIQPPGIDKNGDTVVKEPDDVVVPEGNVRFACASIGLTPPGPNGAGVLTTVTLSALASGAGNLDLAWVALTEPEAFVSIPASTQGDCVAIGTGATCAIPTVAPPVTPTPHVSITPGGPTATPGALLPTATPEGPLATPTPLPAGMEAVDLAAACNPVAATYPNATPVQTIAGAVGPAGNLQALWEFGGNAWLGYSPAYPQASDLTAMDFLDVVFICVGGPGSFARPIV
jgi:hypothetical protein